MKIVYALLLLSVVVCGCSSTNQSATAIRIMDYHGIPVKNARAHFSYNVPYTIAYLDAGPTDAQGFARLPSPYKITPKSLVTVTTGSASACLDYLNLGFLMNGVLTLTIPPNTGSDDTPNSIHAPSIYLSKEKK